MTYTNNKLTTGFYITLLILLVIMSVDIIWRATTGDTTLLGDPYYEDKILATQRAPIALICTWLIVALSVIVATIGHIKSRLNKSL